MISDREIKEWYSGIVGQFRYYDWGEVKGGSGKYEKLYSRCCRVDGSDE